MAAGDITDALLVDLGVKLEDIETTSPIFSESDRLQFLNDAQVELATMLDDGYLTELQETEPQALDSGSVALSSLNSGEPVFRGAEGIKAVNITPAGGTAKFAIRVESDNLEQTNNTLTGYSDTFPKYYIWADVIYPLLDTFVGSSADIYFLIYPTTMTTDVDPILNKSLHGIMLELAASRGFTVNNALDRAASLRQVAYDKINMLNGRKGDT